MSDDAMMGAAGAAVSSAARLEAMALAMWRVKGGTAHPREVLLERDRALSGLAELGLHLRRAGVDKELADIYSRISCLAMSLACGTLGARPATRSAVTLRLLAVNLSNRRAVARAS